MNTVNLCKVLVVSSLLLISVPASANKEALAKAQYMLRQMNAELNQLKVQNQKVLSEKTQLEKEKEKLQKSYDRLSNKSEKNKVAMKDKFVELKKIYKDEIGVHKETKKQLGEMTAEKKRLFDIATEQTQKIDLCVGNNNKLFDINQELLVKYENKGVWDSMSQAEPFSQLTQVEIENLVDDYQYKLDDLRVEAGM